MDAREGRLWVLNQEPYRPGKLLIFLVKHVIIVFSFTSADKVPCDSSKTAPNTSSIVEIMFGQII